MKYTKLNMNQMQAWSAVFKHTNYSSITWWHEVKELDLV